METEKPTEAHGHRPSNNPLADYLPANASPTLVRMAEAAVLAGQLLLQAASRRGALSVTEKTAGDFVSEADIAAERAIHKHLTQFFPDYGWLGEEMIAEPSQGSGCRWIVDPLDGTTNFLKGLPHWAVSIALCDGELPLAGVVFDPAKGEFFSAEAGKGAYLNGHPIKVSQEVPLGSTLLATGVPAGGRTTYLPHCLEDLEKTMPLTAGVRRWGTASLDLAYVAAGRFDGYWERNLGPWDIAAGILLVEEAGGIVAPLWPETSVLSSGSFLCSSGAHQNVIATHINTERATS